MIRAVTWLERFMRFSPLLNPQPQLIMNGIIPMSSQSTSIWEEDLSTWFAVPKQKVSHSKKRMKQQFKNVIRPKQHICTCPRTGELTLRHRLPFNWEDYLTTFEYEAEEVNELNVDREADTK
jgi:ribosomal protein L32